MVTIVNASRRCQAGNSRESGVGSLGVWKSSSLESGVPSLKPDSILPGTPPDSRLQDFQTPLPDSRLRTPDSGLPGGSASPVRGHWAQKREKAFSTGGLQNAHDTHVAKTEAEEKQKRNCSPHVQSGCICDSQQKVNGERQFQQRQEAALAFVLLPLPGLVVRLLHPVLWRPHKFRLHSKERQILRVHLRMPNRYLTPSP